MELKDVFTIVKADRYTDAGRAEIDDARRTYKPGEISEKTGLQKQPNGTWAPPKKGATGRKMSEKQINKRTSKGISVEQIGEGKSFKNKNGAKIDITGTGTDGSIQFMVTTSEGTKQSHHARSKEEMERILSVNGYESAESKPAAPQRSDAYKRGENMAEPVSNKQKEGRAQFAGVLSRYRDKSVIEQRDRMQEKIDSFEDDMKEYDRIGASSSDYAERINQQNFMKGAMQAINDEIKARGLKDAACGTMDAQRKTYRPGEISQKTGLQKQGDGSWAPPKKGGSAAGAKKDEGKKPLSNKEGQSYVETGAKMIQNELDALKRGQISKEQFKQHVQAINNSTNEILKSGGNAGNKSEESKPATRETLEEKYGPRAAVYRDAHVYSKDIGPLPKEQQKEWFKAWDNVITNKFRTQWKAEEAKKKGVESYDVPNPDMDYDKETGLITVWTDNGKMFFKTKISGNLETTVDPDTGKAKKQRYVLYQRNYDGNKDSEDSISFDFAGTKDAAPRALTGDCKVRVKK